MADFQQHSVADHNRISEAYDGYDLTWEQYQEVLEASQDADPDRPGYQHPQDVFDPWASALHDTVSF